MRNLFIYFLATFFSLLCSYGQESYTLEECLNIALTNNYDLKGVELKAASSRVNMQQAWGDMMPALNGNYNLGINNGRSIDPFTNSYVNQKLTFSNAGLSLGIPVFNGFKLKNTLKQSYLNLKASEMEIEEAKQNLALNITLTYLQVLNMRDLLKLSKSRQQVTQQQVDRLKILYDEGEGNPADYTDMKGQLASDELAVISARNSLKSAITDLFQLMGVDSDFEALFEDVAPQEESALYALSDDDIYNEALRNLATFKAIELRKDAAKTAVSVARSNFAPQISLFGQLNTNYSSAAQLFTETGSTEVETGSYVNINSNQYNVLTSQTQYAASDIDYKDQFENNLSTSYGVSVSIPLFNGFRAKNNVKLKKIQLEETKTELEQTKFKYRQSIELAYTNMEAALSRYETLEKQVEDFSESFRVNEIRFNNGVSNVVAYIISKNNLDAAKQNLSMARYEYILRTKILDYYRGGF